MNIINLHRLLMLPVWFFQLFTAQKSLVKNPLLGSVRLNLMGLHVIRLVLAHCMASFRRMFVYYRLAKEDRVFYKANGFLIKTNFLDTRKFEKIKKELADFSQENNVIVDGDSLTERRSFHASSLEKYPSLKGWLNNKAYLNLLHYVGAKKMMPSMASFNVVHGHKDPQRVFHTDTFYPIMKSWFYLHDVVMEKGPFHYIPGSHKLTWRRIKLEYMMSTGRGFKGMNVNRGGSPRYTKEMIAYLDLPSEKIFCVAKNTLVVANTFGIHRRGDALKNVERDSIFASIRPFFPFSFFPGLNRRWPAKLKAKFFNTMLSTNETKKSSTTLARKLRVYWQGDSQLLKDKSKVNPLSND